MVLSSVAGHQLSLIELETARFFDILHVVLDYLAIPLVRLLFSSPVPWLSFSGHLSPRHTTRNLRGSVPLSLFPLRIRIEEFR